MFRELCALISYFVQTTLLIWSLVSNAFLYTLSFPPAPQQACLQDLRSRLVNMANIIQGRFESETENLQQKQDWYKSNQGSLTKEEETDYTTFCKDKMFTIHILEERLKRWALVSCPFSTIMESEHCVIVDPFLLKKGTMLQ